MVIFEIKTTTKDNELLCNFRREELDKTLREREACLSKVKESGHQTTLSLTAQLRDREATVEEAHLKVKELEWTMEDLRKDKDSVIQRLDPYSNQGIFVFL